MELSFFQKVYVVLKKVPEGKVVTYGQIACKIGNPHAARQVGYALHRNPEPIVIPCHRVVNRNGKLSFSFAFGGINAQKTLLEKEDVKVNADFTVDLKKYLWNMEDVKIDFDIDKK